MCMRMVSSRRRCMIIPVEIRMRESVVGRGIFMISAALRTDARAYVYVNGSIRGYCGMHCSVLPFVEYP